MLPRDIKPKKSDQQIFAEAWLKTHKLPWLFPDTEPINSTEYLEFFHRQQGAMLVCRCPSSYRFELLERHKDKIAFSQHLIEGLQVSPYTMLQFGPKFHVLAEWIWDAEEETFHVATTLFYGKNSEYTQFLEENTDLARFDDKAFGFAAGRSD